MSCQCCDLCWYNCSNPLLFAVSSMRKLAADRNVVFAGKRWSFRQGIPMNRRQLQKLGVPEDCVKSAIAAIHSIRREQSGGKKEVKQLLQAVLVAPEHNFARQLHKDANTIAQ